MKTGLLLLLLLPLCFAAPGEHIVDTKADHVRTNSHEETHSAHDQRGSKIFSRAHSQEQDGHTRDHHVHGKWSAGVVLNENGRQVVTNIGEKAFNSYFARCPVVRYTRNGAVHAVYMRTSPFPPSFNAFTLFTDTWASDHNQINVDFKLYNSFEDAKGDEGAWAFCNYDDPDVGFPRDCGKTGPVGNKWFSMPGGRVQARGIGSGIGFHIFTGSMCPSPLGSGDKVSTASSSERSFHGIVTFSSDRDDGDEEGDGEAVPTQPTSTTTLEDSPPEDEQTPPITRGVKRACFLYEDCGYKGRGLKVYDGNKESSLAKWNFNARASSFKVDANCKLHVWSSTNYQGNKGYVDDCVRCVTTNWNNQVRSVKCICEEYNPWENPSQWFIDASDC